MLILLYTIITVWFISHSISRPIDKFISIGKDNNGKHGKDLHKDFEMITYNDDYIINSLLISCKRLFFGKGRNEKRKVNKQRKLMNAYNNISQIKSNDMIIDEKEIIKKVNKKEINFFEKYEPSKDDNNRVRKSNVTENEYNNHIHSTITNINNNNNVNNTKISYKTNNHIMNIEDIDYFLLSKHFIMEKIPSWNETLTRDNEYYVLLMNELKSKKNNDV